MKLSEVLKDIQYSLKGNDVDIKGIEYDSRKVTKGSLFVAIKGYNTDGHKYIEEAISAGAAAVLAEYVEGELPVPAAITNNTRKALAAASARLYGQSAKRLKIIGVTGTNGKTTTTYLIKQILDFAGFKTGLIGTNQNMIGTEVLKAERTTPESLELHKLFRDMEEEGVTHVVMEVSSHSLELYRTWGIDFEVGVFTNLTQDHLDFHQSMEQYLRAKAKLFSASKTSVINADDKWGREILKGASGAVLTYGIEKKCDYKAENIRLSERGVIFSLRAEGGVHDIRLGIPGRFSVYNALAAACACLALGISIEDIIKGLIIAKGVRGRAEVVALPTPYTVIIDYAHTPDGLENIIKAVRGFARGRVITLFGCGGDRDRTKRPKMGKIAGTLSDYCIVTSDNPRTEDPNKIIDDILEGMRGMEERYTVITNRREAIEHAMNIALPGDAVILAGKGHETYQILADKTIDFDERAIVKEIFSEMQKN